MEVPMRLNMWILWAVTLNHLTWVACLFVDGNVTKVTSVSHVALFLGGRWTSFAGLLVISVAAAAGLLLRNRMLSLSCLLPQQFLVLASATAAINSIWSGKFADGVERGSAFLGGDQGIHVWLAILHTVSICEVHLAELIQIAKLKWKAN